MELPMTAGSRHPELRRKTVPFDTITLQQACNADKRNLELNSAIHRQFREAHEGHKPHAGMLMQAPNAEGLAK